MIKHIANLIVFSALSACGSSQDVFPSHSGRTAGGEACNPNESPACFPEGVVRNPEAKPSECGPDRQWQNNECVPVQREKSAPQEPVPALVEIDPLRDPRKAGARARAPALVKAEHQLLAALMEHTPGTSPDWRPIVFRLGDTASELSRISEADRKWAGEKAIFYYRLIASDETRSCAANERCADEALYYIGLEWEAKDRMDEARKAYLELIRKHPQSRFVSYAYFGFGELFLAKAKKEGQDFELAVKTYEKAVTLGDRTIAPEALLRLAEIASAQGDTQKSAEYVRRLQKDYPNSRAAQSIPNPSNSNAIPSN